MNLKDRWNKYKSRKKSAIISDIFLVALIIVMLVPSWRREVGALVVRVVMTSPDIEEMQPEKLSQSALTLTYRDDNGVAYQLGQMLDKPVLLTYWATWCHHCVAELPALAELYEKTSNDIHLVILVNEDLEKVNSYLQQKGYDLPVYRQVNASAPMISSNKIPASFLIDRNANLVLKETGATKWGSDSFISYVKSL